MQRIKPAQPRGINPRPAEVVATICDAPGCGNDIDKAENPVGNDDADFCSEACEIRTRLMDSLYALEVKWGRETTASWRGEVIDTLMDELGLGWEDK